MPSSGHPGEITVKDLLEVTLSMTLGQSFPGLPVKARLLISPATELGLCSTSLVAEAGYHFSFPFPELVKDEHLKK